MIKIADINMDNVNIEIQSSSDKASSGLDRLINSLSNLKNKLNSTTASSTNFINKMKNFNFKNPFKDFNFNNSFKNFNNPFNNFNKDGNKSSQIMERLNKAGEIVGQTFQKLTQRASRFISTLFKVSTLRIGIKGLDAAFGGVGGKLAGIGNSLRNVIKNFSKYALALYGIRSAFYAVRNVSNEFLSSQNAAAQQLSVNISYLKYALGGALKPVIEYLTNLIYSILKALQALIYGFFKINIFAGLTAKSYSGVTKGVKDTNKELQKQLQGFDELNNITLETAKNTGAGSGGGGGATPTFDLSKVDPKFKDLFKDLDKIAEKAADKINKALEKINWEKQRKRAEENAEKIASALNTFTSKIKWNLVGSSIAGGLNTAMAFTDTFVQKYKWTELGQNIGKAFNKMVKDIDWDLAGRYVTDGLKEAILTAAALIKETDFKTLGDKIGQMINSAIDNIPWTELGQLFNDFIIGILDFLIHVKDTINTDKVKKAWQDAFSQIKWSEIFGKITELISDTGWLGTLGFALVFAGGSWKMKLAAVGLVLGITTLTSSDTVSDNDKISTITKALTGGALGGAYLAFKAGKWQLGLKGIVLAVGIGSISLTFDAVKQAESGNTDGGVLLQGIASSLGTGVSAGVLTKNVYIGIAATLMSFTVQAQKIGRANQWYPLKRALDATDMDDNANSFRKVIAIQLDFMSYFKISADNIFGEENVTKVIFQVIKNILSEVAEKLEKLGWFGKAIATALRSGFKDEEKNMEKDISGSVNVSLNNAQPSINSTAKGNGITTLKELRDGFNSKQTELQKTVQNVQVDSFKNVRANVNSTARLSGEQALNNEGTGLTSKQKELQDKIKKIQNDGFTKARPTVNSTSKTSGEQSLKNFETGIENRKKNLNTTLETISTNIKNNIKPTESTMNGIGSNVVKGVGEGISGANKSGGFLWDALSGVAKNIGSWLKGFLGIKSPSRVMRDQIGKFIPLGIAEGIKGSADSVYDEMQKIANNVAEFSFEDTSDLLNAKLDVEYDVNREGISAKLDAQSEVTFEDGMKKVADYCYQAIRDGFDTVEAPYVDVNIGNDKVYKGYAKYKNQETNRYGLNF